MSALHTLLFLGIFLLAKPAHCLLCLPEQGNKDKPGDYLRALTSSLIHMKEGQDIISAALKKTDSPVTMMNGFRSFQNYMDCAKSLVEPYQDSDNDTISSSSKAIVSAATSIVLLNKDMQTEIKNLLDGKAPAEGAGTRAVRQSTQAGLVDDAWKMITLATTMATHSFVKEQGTLDISKSDRDNAVSDLKRVFGKALKSKDKNLRLIFTAGLLIKFLEEKWKFASSSAEPSKSKATRDTTGKAH